MSVRLSDESYAGWQSFADEYGTTIAALLEIIGLELGPGGEIPQERREMYGTRARELSQERKRRRPGGSECG